MIDQEHIFFIRYVTLMPITQYITINLLLDLLIMPKHMNILICSYNNEKNLKINFDISEFYEHNITSEIIACKYLEL